MADSERSVILALSPKAARFVLERMQPDGTATMDEPPEAIWARDITVEIESQLAVKA